MQDFLLENTKKKEKRQPCSVIALAICVCNSAQSPRMTLFSLWAISEKNVANIRRRKGETGMDWLVQSCFFSWVSAGETGSPR